MNTLVKQIWSEAAADMPAVNTWQEQTQFMEQFAKQIVGETILAVLATNHTQAVYTTFDQQLMDGAVARVVDQIRNHWNFQ